MTLSRRASATPRDLTGSGWHDILPPLPSPPALERDVHTDWLIIGAGFAGCHAARRLYEHDPAADAILLEAQSIGFGACGRNSGFMIDLPHELQSDDYRAEAGGKAEISLNRQAIEFARQCADEFALADYFRIDGKYHGAADHAGTQALSAFCQGLEAVGEPFEILDAHAMHAVTGCSFYRSGIFTPGCALLQPAGYIRGLVHGMNARFDGLRVFAHSPALEISGRHGAYRVSTPRGTIEAKRVILTINGHLESFGWKRRRLMHVFTFASMTERLTASQRAALGGADAWGLVSAHPMGTTVRRTVDHRLVIRNTFTYNPNMETTGAQVRQLGRRHDRAFHQRFAHLGPVNMEYRWGGHLCLSRNSVPVFGELEPNLFAACCHNGLGTSKGTLGGLSIVDLALGHRTPAVDALHGSDEPSKLLPAPIMTPAARTYLAFAQWRAGKN